LERTCASSFAQGYGGTKTLELFHFVFPIIGSFQGDFSNVWNFSAPFFQTLEISRPFFPIIGNPLADGSANRPYQRPSVLICVYLWSKLLAV
jgi:hypothetical protein